MTPQRPDQGLADQAPTDQAIAAALDGLQDLTDLPVAEHVARFAAVHDALTAALSRIDEV